MPTLTDVLQRYKVPFRQHGEDHHVTGGWIGCQCPWCSSSGFHFGFHLSTGATSCWKCGNHNSIRSLARLCRIDYSEASKLLDLKTPFPKTRAVGTLEFPFGASTVSSVTPLPLPHHRYLESRGFDPVEIQKLWTVSAIGKEHKLSWRLFVPISNPTGRIVSWTTRAIGSTNGPKYISAAASQEEEPHKHLLYGAQLARLSIVIVEGPLDAWAIGPGAVATCGVSYSRQQIDAMSRYPYRAVCFDREPVAQRRAAKLCEELDGYPGRTTRIELLTGEDPADADPAEIAEIRRDFLG